MSVFSLTILLLGLLLSISFSVELDQEEEGERQSGRVTIDLSGWWKMDKIRPGQGVKESYHNIRYNSEARLTTLGLP